MAASLRAPTRGSTGAEHTSAPSRRCSFLQEAAQKVSEQQLTQLAAELMSRAQFVARESNLPRGVFKGVSCCVACGYPAERTHQAATACKLCEYSPRKRKRGGASRSSKITTKTGEVAAQILCTSNETGDRQQVASKKESDDDDGADEAEEKANGAPTAPLGGEQQHHTESLLPKKKKKKKKKKLKTPR